MLDVQVGAELKKGGAEDPQQLLRLGSALDVARNHLIACSSAREGLDRDLISPRPCSEEEPGPARPGPASQAAAADRPLHDSPDSLAHAEELTRATSLEQLPLMLRRQLADDTVAAQQPHAATESARQPEQAAQLGTFCWDLAEQRTGGHTPFHDAASTADSGESSASLQLEHMQHWPVSTPTAFIPYHQSVAVSSVLHCHMSKPSPSITTLVLSIP